MASSLLPLTVILGPTASGKTDLAVELAKKFDGEIINADSRQIYKEIDIASAKPKFIQTDELKNRETEKLYHGIPHRLFDVVKPDEEFNVTHYKRLAIEIINDIHARGKLPFLVGGTGLWISAVVDNLDLPDVPPNVQLRKRLDHPFRHSRENGNPDAVLDLIEEEKQASKTDLGLLFSGSPIESGMTVTTDQLYQQLIVKDPAAAEFIDSKNRRRITRALEVIEATGKPFSAQRKKGPPLFRVLELGLTRPMKELEDKIMRRIEEQMNEGLEKEARALFSKYDPSLPSLSSISVREWKDYIDGKQTLPETLHLIYLHNRQYAKRQMTWFKRDKRIEWIQNKDEAMSLIHKFHITT